MDYLSGFLLIGSALLFSIDARFSGFEPLCFNQLSVSNFLVLLLLLFHSGQLLFFEHFHTSLFEGLEAKNVEHRFNLFIEIK